MADRLDKYSRMIEVYRVALEIVQRDKLDWALLFKRAEYNDHRKHEVIYEVAFRTNETYHMIAKFFDMDYRHVQYVMNKMDRLTFSP